MSSPTRDTANRKATIWPMSKKDEFGRKIYSAPFVISCSFGRGDGSSYKDDEGIKFIPTFIAWSEFDGSYTQPREGDFIALDDHSLVLLPEDVEHSLPIKKTEISDCSLLGEFDDIRIMA